LKSEYVYSFPPKPTDTQTHTEAEKSPYVMAVHADNNKKWR